MLIKFIFFLFIDNIFSLHKNRFQISSNQLAVLFVSWEKKEKKKIIDYI